MDNRSDFPPFGIGAFSTCENLAQLLLVVEMMVLVLLEGLSWYLAALVILPLLSWSAWKRVKKLICEAGMTALPMTVEDEARIVASPTPDEETVGWMNEIIEQFWERSLSPHVTPALLNWQLAKMQRSLSTDNPTLSELVAKLKVVRLTLGSSPLVISKLMEEVRGFLGSALDLPTMGTLS